jgi:hypothetical protein
MKKKLSMVWLAPTIAGPLIGLIVTGIIVVFLVVPMLDGSDEADAEHGEPGITETDNGQSEEGTSTETDDADSSNLDEPDGAGSESDRTGNSEESQEDDPQEGTDDEEDEGATFQPGG